MYCKKCIHPLGAITIAQLIPILVVLAMVATFAQAQSLISSTFPPDLARKLEVMRSTCREYAKTIDEPSNPLYNKVGDDGLAFFEVAGHQGVAIDTLHVCGDGQQCLKGVNCATGYTHTVEIYVNSNGWKKVFGDEVTEPIHLTIDRATGELKSMAFKIAGWDDAKCRVPAHIKRKHGATSWKAYACDYLLKWRNDRFVYERQ